MRFYGGGYINTIKNTFPEIVFDDTKFSLHSLRTYYLLNLFYLLIFNFILYLILEEHWKDVKNRRKYFDTFAKTKEFDPLLSSSWYNISIDKNDLKVFIFYFYFYLNFH